MELIKTTAGGGYTSFASGLPDPQLFPVDTLRALTDEVLTRDGRAALQYGPAEGYLPLRDYVAGLLRERGFAGVTAEHVLITTGSQQALDLAARALLDPGDLVALETPSYLAAVQAFDSYEAAYAPVPMDSAGMCPQALSSARGAKLLYTLPNFQNPSGLTLAGERREKLAAWSASNGLALLEDDAYHDLRYDGEALPPVAALAPNPWAIYTGTFSKVVAPGVRVGYLCAQPEVVRRLGELKQITDLHTGSLTQRVVFEYCRAGHLEPGIARLRAAYRPRREAMLSALETHLGGIAEWTPPAGGMFVFVSLSEGLNASRLLQRSLERRVVFVPGESFYPGPKRPKNTLRLNFVSAGEEAIAAGIRVLGDVVREALA
jgi:2-aminoadipate transaminase